MIFVLFMMQFLFTDVFRLHRSLKATDKRKGGGTLLALSAETCGTKIDLMNIPDTSFFNLPFVDAVCVNVQKLNLISW